MKVSLNLNEPHNKNNINFEGYKPVKSQYGDKEYEFNYAFDDNKFDCYLEIYSVEQDENNNYSVTGILDKIESGNDKNHEKGIKLQNGKPTKIDLSACYNLASDEPFAYHYKLYPKNSDNPVPIYKIDAGNIINPSFQTKNAYDIYNIVTDRASTVTKGGSMKLIVPDNYNVIWKYNKDNEIVKKTPEEITKLLKSSKNFSNKIGGSLAGIEKDLDDGKLDNFTRIITTPLFTDDSLSAHAYWNKNCFQMAQALGNINNYISIQKKLFAKGMNLVSDGAYVNEGLEGVHFQHILKWGTKSPYFHWFNITGLQTSPLGLGVFGKNIDNVTHKLVNSPYEFAQNSDGSVAIKSNRKNYNPQKPTYIQIYDKRLASGAQMNDKELIKAYERFDKNYLEINNHNDTVIPYSFQINPETYKKNVLLLNNYNRSVPEGEKINLYSGKGTRTVTQFEYFAFDGKHEGGFYTWDANPDIAKLNFIFSNTQTQTLKNILNRTKRAEETALLKQKNMEVQDYAVSSAQFWTKKTNQILNLNVAQHLRNIEDKNAQQIYKIIKEQANGKIFPKDLDVTEQIVKNVLNNTYNLHGTDSVESFKDSIIEGLMDVPLDSIEVGDDIVAALSSPYMSKRATSQDQIGVSRYEMYQNNNPHISPEYEEAYELTDTMYTKEMAKFAHEILTAIEFKLPENNKLHDEYGNATPFGKYLIPLLTSEIARFALIKAIDPKTDYSYDSETGEITYDYEALKKTSLKGMGIIGDSPEDEAILLVNKLRKGIKKISPSDKEKLASALWKSIKGTNLQSFKLAEMIVDRTQAGLDWRIDAAKDIGDIESIRNKKTDFEYTWNQIIKFWQIFTDGVKKYHPDAYIAAELTNKDEIFNAGNYIYKDIKNNRIIKSDPRYSSAEEAVKKLINEAGFTTIANYEYLAADITSIFGKLFAPEGGGVEKGTDKGKTIINQLIGGANFLYSAPLEASIYSYIFAGNHDKCRALEGYAMDMDMVYADLTDEKNYEYRKRAYKILHGMHNNPSPQEVNNYKYDYVSNIAVAKSEAIIHGMGRALQQTGFDENKKNYIYGKILAALKNLASGIYKDEFKEAEGFGTKDYNIALDIVFDEMDYLESDANKQLTNEEKQKLKNKTLEMILDPAMSKLLGQTKFLVALTGNPTLYAGDEVGSTGFETPTKNIYLQNRNIIHDEWADPENKDYKEFVKRFKDNMDYQYNLRTRPELQPLNDGTPYALKEQEANYENINYNDEFDHSKGISGYDNGKTQVSALLRQSPNGKMTVSVFNTAGLNHDIYNKKYYEPAKLTLPYIDLNEGWNGKAGLAGGLKPGLKFRNANKDDPTTYYVNDKNQITGPDNTPITFKDSTLILYHEPSFTGRRVLYNPRYNLVSNPYANKERHNVGEKLALLSK